ncbi:hypothetical protein ACOSP7_023057 [Xanthoceras sorbifolium]
MVPSFTMKGVVFLSPKQIHIAEVCAGEKLQQLERTDSDGSSTWQSRFHFEEAWLHDAETKGIIKKGWQQL